MDPPPAVESQPLLLPPTIIRILSLSFSKQLSEIITKVNEKYPDNKAPPLEYDTFIFSSQEEKFASKFKTIKIQTAWRMKRISRNFKIRQKKLKHRGYIVKEIISSEENYNNSLDLVVRNVIKPSENCELLTKDQLHTLFSHLTNITLFSKEISNNLKQRSTPTFDCRKTEFLDIFLKFFDFYKIYSPYCNNFPDAQNLLGEIRSDPKRPFCQLLKKLEYTQHLQNLNLLDHLIKPIQRLPKYELLFKDLKKNTEKTHPDYNNIEVALEKFIQLNKDNNQKMESYLKQLKLFELQKLFGGQNINLFDKHRKFLQEEALYIIKEDIPRPIILYILSDLLLVTEVSEIGTYSLIHQLQLDSASFVCDLQNAKYFKWIFSVYGPTGGLIFNTDTKEHKIEVIDLLEKAIDNLKAIIPLKKEISGLVPEKKPQKNFRLRTIGTLRRGIRGFKPYTLYVVQIQVNGKHFRLYIRFSELIEIENIVKQKIPGIKIPHFPKTLSNYFMSQQLKIIETRKLMIENFLQTLLQNTEIAKSAKEVLGYLNLPKNFFDIDVSDNQGLIIDKNELLGENSLFYELYKRFYSNNLFLEGEKTEINEKPIEITVVLLDKSQVKIKVERNMRCIEVCREIAKKIGLISWLDFKLFMTNTAKKEELLLDDEEFLLKSMEFVEEKEASFFEKISLNFRKLKKIVTNSEYTLIFKKQGFFDEKLENIDMEKDKKRLHLIFIQVFQEIYEGKYAINAMNYLFIGGIRLYTIYHKYPKDMKLGFNNLKECVPVNILKSKGKNIEENLMNLWEDIGNEIDYLSKIHEQPNEKHVNNRDFQIDIAKKLLINFIRKNKLYGSNLFWVFILKKEKNDLKDCPDFIWLTIKLESIAILHPSEVSKFYKEINLKDIAEYMVYPNCIKMRLTDNTKYRFLSNKSFEIGELLYQYKAFQNEK